MNILLVTLFPLELNTSVSISNVGLLKGLIQLGHKVTVLVPWMGNNGDKDDASLDLPINILRISGPVYGEHYKLIKNRIIRKLIKELSFLNETTNAYLPYADSIDVPKEYFDVVISTSDPKGSHLFTKRLINRGLQYGQWIQHWGDPLSGDINRRNCYPSWLIQKYEQHIIKQADKVVYVSPFTLHQQQKDIPIYSHKMCFVPLPCNEKVDTMEPIAQSNRLRLSYLGDYLPSTRNILPLYNAVKQLDNVELTIAGISSLRLKDTKNIHVFPRLPMSDVHRIEAESDVLVSVGNLRGTQIPGKIYYIASTQKHILVIVDGDNKDAMKQYINSYDRYVCCDNTVESIQQVLSDIQSVKKEYLIPSILLPINVASAVLSKM